MTEREIRKAVAQGLGRAILFLRAAVSDEYFGLVLSLCLKNQEFDPLFEVRGDYMCRLVATLPSQLDLVEPLGAALVSSKNRRDRAQIRAVLGHLCRAGSMGARQILLKDFERFRLEDRQFRYAPQYLGYEGLELLLAQARRLEDWEIRGVYEDAVEQFGEERTLDAFRRLAPSKIDAGLGRVPERPRPPNEEVSASECLRRLALGESVLGPFLKVAKEDDWKMAAQLAFDASDVKVLRRAAMILKRHPWPLDVEEALVKAQEDADPDLRRFRFSMLHGTHVPILRAWAVERLQGSSRSFDFLNAFGLMKCNAERRDRPLLTRALLASKWNPVWFHRAGIDVTSLACGTTTEMLQTIYEHGYCHECRNYVVRRLAKRRAMPLSQWEECLEDSDEDTRKLAQQHVLSGASDHVAHE